jgi:hypothetical protein
MTAQDLAEPATEMAGRMNGLIFFVSIWVDSWFNF